ncbi:MAG: hypothetical protein ACUVWX_14445, partial [Kiritimatiellia bacterium]
MARRKTTTPKRPIESYEHKDKERVNNPPVGLVTPETDQDAGQQEKPYAYDPHLDPQLIWAAKAEHTSFAVPTVSLHVHERIDPRTIIEAVRVVNSGQGIVNSEQVQMPLFEVERKEPLRSAIEFYPHRHGWSNRLIAGDSLLVMNSLLEKEGLALFTNHYPRLRLLQHQDRRRRIGRRGQDRRLAARHRLRRAQPLSA